MTVYSFMEMRGKGHLKRKEGKMEGRKQASK